MHLHSYNPDRLSTRLESESSVNRLLSINFKLQDTYLLFFLYFLRGIEKHIYLSVFSGMHLISDLRFFASSVIIKLKP